MTGFEEFLIGTIRLSTPLILAALGEVVTQRAGVINIGIEGMMLCGAFAGFVVAHISGSAYAGLMGACAASALTGVFLAFMCVARKADQIVVGTGINIAMLGLTGVLNRGMFGLEQSISTAGFGIVRLPALSGLPVVGSALFAQPVLVYLSGFAAIGIWLFLRSPLALGLRACGANPEAADAAGVRVDTVRWFAVLFGAIMAGAAGAFLSLAQTNTFTENMSSGRGFIALAVVIFGRWNPIGIVLAALIFGSANEAQFWFQARGSALQMFGTIITIPYQALLALPYIATLSLLGVYAGKYRGPKALGHPYVRSS